MRWLFRICAVDILDSHHLLNILQQQSYRSMNVTCENKLILFLAKLGKKLPYFVCDVIVIGIVYMDTLDGFLPLLLCSA